jgi:hypothetical protein
MNRGWLKYSLATMVVLTGLAGTDRGQEVAPESGVRETNRPTSSQSSQ